MNAWCGNHLSYRAYDGPVLNLIGWADDPLARPAGGPRHPRGEDVCMGGGDLPASWADQKEGVLYPMYLLLLEADRSRVCADHRSGVSLNRIS